MRIKINVTKEILEKSMYCPMIGNCTVEQHELIRTNCAFSVAWRELFPDAKVWHSCTWLTPNYTVVNQVRHSDEVSLYIQKFDKCLSFEERLTLPEASFEFDIPDSAIDSIGLQELETILSKSVNLELVDR